MATTTRRMSGSHLVLMLVGLLCAAPFASAHPHAWIDLRSTVTLDETGRATAIVQEWQFDQLYTALLVDEFGRTPEALRAHAAAILDQLRAFDYFTEIRVAGEPVAPGLVLEFESEVRSGRFRIRFVVPLETQPDVARHDLSYAVYDPTYYIEILHQKEPDVSFDGGKSGDCRGELVAPNPPTDAIMKARALDVDAEADDSLGGAVRRARGDPLPLMLRRPPRAILVVGALLGVGALIYVMAPAASDLWWRLVLEVQAAQRTLHRELAATLQAVQENETAASWWLVTLSFLYGVLHAAGPGHGKVVISTYLLTQPSGLGRGIALSLFTALCQGLTAILAVGLLVAILGRSLRFAQTTANDLELLSYALVALVGLVLVVTRARRLVPGTSVREQSAPTTGHHHEPHDSKHAASDGCCGHAHVPAPAQLDTPLSWRAIAGMALAVGVRPCSGAILVLLVARSAQLEWAGVAAVLAMSLGTGVTVSILAAISVYARSYAVRFAARLPGPSARPALALDLIALVGGLVILAAGAMLFQATWTAPAHPLR